MIVYFSQGKKELPWRGPGNINVNLTSFIINVQTPLIVAGLIFFRVLAQIRLRKSDQNTLVIFV